MADPSSVTFDSIDLKVSQTIQLVPNPLDGKDLFDCVYIGAIDNEALIVSAPASGEFPSLEEGQQVVIRILMPEGVAIFSTTVLYLSDVPTFMVYLDYPQVVKFNQIRKSKRVNVKLPVLVSAFEPGAPQNADGKIIDISISGAGLESSIDLGDAEDLVQIKGKFKVASIQRILSIKAIIRSKRTIAPNQIVYGLEFIDDEDEDALLVLFGFIFNAMAFGEFQEIK